MEEDKLSLESLLSEAAGNKPTTPPPAVEEPVVEAPVVGEPAVEEPVVEEPVAEEPKKKTTEKPNPMKEVRDKLSQEQKEKQKISGAVKRFTTGSYDFKLKDFVVDGEVDYDALNAKMDEIDLKVKAEGRGISPEIQAEIDRIEKEKLELEKDKLRVGMDRALTELQLERGLKTADVNNFFKDALAVKKNPYQ